MIGYHALRVANKSETAIVNIDDYLFITTNGTNYLVGYVGAEKELVLPKDYKGENYSINQYAFRDYDTITSVVIPETVIGIGKGAFAGCTSLSTINIPTSVKEILYETFSGCSSLKFIRIPDSVISIGQSAFTACVNLESVVISSYVNSIIYYAFDNCSRLDKIYYEGHENEWLTISIGKNNEELSSATRYYYSETAPTTEGNFWHYGENGEIVVW